MFFVFKRFKILCCRLDAEMKDGICAGVALRTKREGKEGVSDDDKHFFGGMDCLGKAQLRPC